MTLPSPRRLLRAVLAVLVVPATVTLAPALLPAAAPGVGVAAAASAHPKLDATLAAAKRATTMNAAYRYGGGHGATPSSTPSNTDCSGFVRWAYYQGFRYDIGSGSSESVRTSGRFTKTSNPQPGDLAFFGSGGRGPATHVGVYAGRNAAGVPTLIHNSTPGTVVHTSTFSSYYTSRLIGYYHLTAVRDVAAPAKRASSFGIAVSDATLRPGQAATVNVGLRWGTARLARQPVKLYQLVGGVWKLGASGTTNAIGNYAFRIYGGRTATSYRATFAGNATYLPSTSSAVRVTVASR